MSSVHYKFKNAKQYKSVSFDGAYISLGKLKAAIIEASFGEADTIDLRITNAQTNEVYEDDHALVPKNTSVTVLRMPGKGKATKLPQAKKPMIQPPSYVGSGKSKYQMYLTTTESEGGTEEEKLANFQSQTSEAWGENNFVNVNKRGRSSYVPATYICRRCGGAGHRISDCPTQGDEKYDTYKMKRTTGIPRSQLEQTTDQTLPGVMINPTDSTFWIYKVQKHVSTAQTSGGADELPGKAQMVPTKVDASKPLNPALTCPMCKKLYRDAVQTPCCHETFCDMCIRESLLGSEYFMCPKCSTRDVSPDALTPYVKMRLAVARFRRTGEVVLPSEMESDVDTDNNNEDDHNSDTETKASAEASNSASVPTNTISSINTRGGGSDSGGKSPAETANENGRDNGQGSPHPRSSTRRNDQRGDRTSEDGSDNNDHPRHSNGRDDGRHAGLPWEGGVPYPVPNKMSHMQGGGLPMGGGEMRYGPPGVHHGGMHGVNTHMQRGMMHPNMAPRPQFAMNARMDPRQQQMLYMQQQQMMHRGGGGPAYGPRGGVLPHMGNPAMFRGGYNGMPWGHPGGPGGGPRRRSRSRSVDSRSSYRSYSRSRSRSPVYRKERGKSGSRGRSTSPARRGRRSKSPSQRREGRSRRRSASPRTKHDKHGTRDASAKSKTEEKHEKRRSRKRSHRDRDRDRSRRRAGSCKDDGSTGDGDAPMEEHGEVGDGTGAPNDERNSPRSDADDGVEDAEDVDSKRSGTTNGDATSPDVTRRKPQRTGSSTSLADAGGIDGILELHATDDVATLADAEEDDDQGVAGLKFRSAANGDAKAEVYGTDVVEDHGGRGERTTRRSHHPRTDHRRETKDRERPGDGAHGQRDRDRRTGDRSRRDPAPDRGGGVVEERERPRGRSQYAEDRDRTKQGASYRAADTYEQPVRDHRERRHADNTRRYHEDRSREDQRDAHAHSHTHGHAHSHVHDRDAARERPRGSRRPADPDHHHDATHTRTTHETQPKDARRSQHSADEYGKDRTGMGGDARLVATDRSTGHGLRGDEREDRDAHGVRVRSSARAPDSHVRAHNMKREHSPSPPRSRHPDDTKRSRQEDASTRVEPKVSGTDAARGTSRTTVSQGVQDHAPHPTPAVQSTVTRASDAQRRDLRTSIRSRLGAATSRQNVSTDAVLPASSHAMGGGGAWGSARDRLATRGTSSTDAGSGAPTVKSTVHRAGSSTSLAARLSAPDNATKGAVRSLVDTSRVRRVSDLRSRLGKVKDAPTDSASSAVRKVDAAPERSVSSRISRIHHRHDDNDGGSGPVIIDERVRNPAIGRSRNREVITIVNDDVGVDVVEVDEDDITDASYHKKHHKRKKHKSKKHRKHK